MPTDKETKKEFKKEASKDPDKFYATKVLKNEGFMRKQCKCGTFFWTTHEKQTICGDPACSGGFKFIGDTPAKQELDYIQVWQRFAELFKKWGYTPIPRYPVVARWRDDTDFVQASIYDFQPYVVSGEVEPPANPLVVPQFCLRFNDIDNVGITGAHYTGFVMIGQHMFVPKEKWDQDKVFLDIHNWLRQGLGLPNSEITYHEDAWAGGGNFGPCMEYFSRGLELGNQVYMLYEQTPKGRQGLKLKVLDMGMGHERNAWFTKATSTSYEAVFPTVCKKLKSATGFVGDDDLMKRFLPYSSYLNIDEVEDIDKTWQQVAKHVGTDVKDLKGTVMPLAALYCIGDHTRSLLVALNDGALPSNVGGGYNLRVLLRRSLSFIDKYGWDLHLPTICRWHAEYLKPLFPELMENLDEVTEILEVEKNKYETTKQKTKQIVAKLKKVNEKTLLQLYDSNGIPPEMLVEAGVKVKVPENFYAKVAELHEQKEQAHATVKEEKLDLTGVPETEALYFDDYMKLKNKAKVLKIIGKNIVLDQTVAYPTSGGQLHDKGEINGQEMVDAFKQGSVIIHVLADEPKFKQGGLVELKLDANRRKQLAQHHSATHIVNAAAKKVLGNHINQAGAKKTEEKAHLDVTHFQAIDDEQLKEIEEEANKIVKQDIKIKTSFMPRGEAEKKYGMSLYQGGAVPGKKIRVVEFPGIDVEACGGTHLHKTSEVGEIKILKSTKISDGIVRITFTAGKAAKKEEKQEQDILSQAAKELSVKKEELPARVEELFSKWKKARKAVKKKKQIDVKELELSSKDTFDGDVLAKVADVLKTQPEHIVKTIQRFKKELEEFKGKLK